MSKKISIVLICIVIAISLAISIYIPNRNKIESENVSIKYSTIEENGKIGVIDQNSKKIIEPQYNEIIIVNPHRAVFVCKNGDETKIIDDKNQEIFKDYDNVFPIQISNEKYEKNIFVYEKDAKFGIVEISGDKITDAKYEEITSFGYKEGELLTKQEGKYGILECNGKTKIKNKYDEIQIDEYYTDEYEYQKSGYIVEVITDEGYRYGYYDNAGVQVLKEEYNKITRIAEISSDKIYLIASQNGQNGVFVNNSKIINTEYQSIEYNSEMQMFLVEKTGRFGAINLNGAKVLDTEYTELTIKGIYLYGKREKEAKVFDVTGKVIDIPFDTIITATPNSKYFIRNDAEGYSIVNKDFEKITNQVYHFIEYSYDNYFIATNEQDKVGIIDLEENVVVEFNYDLIQLIKGKNIIQAIDFATNKTDIYDAEFDLALEMTDANIELLDDEVRVHNNEQEVFLDDNGKVITK